MATPAELIKFQQTLRTLDYTRARMEDLYLGKRIVRRDLDSVYESLFLRAVTSFEGFVEDLFLSILERRTYYKPARNVSLRMKAISHEALMEIVLQGDQYLKWLPFKETEKRARLYLIDGKPFTEIDNGDRTQVQTITTIRNAIAHRSRYAMNEFQVKVIGSRSLLPREKKPAGYLQSRIGSGGSPTRFEVYVQVLNKVATGLC